MIHTAMALHSTLNGNALDTLGRYYTLQAISMAHELHLFEKPSTKLESRLQRGREYTAWAFWIWHVAEVGVTVRDCMMILLIPTRSDSFVTLDVHIVHLLRANSVISPR